MSNEKWTDGLFVNPPGEPFPNNEPSCNEEQDPKDRKAAETVTLEIGLLQLEKIVKMLEQKELPLEEALLLFKDGVGLVQHCTKVLNQAEKQMEILLEGPDGELQIQPASFEVEG